MKLVWRRKALAKLAEVKQYIEQENPTAAREVASRLMNVVKTLSDFPDMAPAGREEGTRELVVSNLPYVFVYRVEVDRILILMLFHTSQAR